MVVNYFVSGKALLNKSYKFLLTDLCKALLIDLYKFVDGYKA